MAVLEKQLFGSVFPTASYPFHNGDHMDQPTFHRLYTKAPDWFHAELIEGVVYFKMPVQFVHGELQSRIATVLTTYASESDAIKTGDGPTTVLNHENEPEPDAVLFVTPEYGGQIQFDRKGYLIGAPDLVIEIANTTHAMDLGAKKRVYQRAGVREYIVVRVPERQIVWFEMTDEGFVERELKNGVLKSTSFPGLWLDVSALFAATAKQLLATVRKGMASPEYGEFIRRLNERQRPRTGSISNGSAKRKKT
jgi:Uma2 family endonuclease